jgi:hypothetical protein
MFLMRQKPKLNAPEVSGLWSNYLANNMSRCILKHFLKTVDDRAIGAVLERAIGLADQHTKWIADLLKKENIPAPIGFSDDDVNLDAPKLFSDPFFLYYLKNMTRMGLSTNGAFLSGASRKDVRRFVSDCLRSSADLYNEIVDLLTEMGLEIRAPYLSYPQKRGEITDKHFLSGWLGKQRPLTAAEMSNLIINLYTCDITRTMLLAFCQTTADDRVRWFMKHGKQVIEKHMNAFLEFLKESNVPAAVPWAIEVTPSTTWTFSEKLMMFQALFLYEMALGNYGISLAISQRRDLSIKYMDLSYETVRLLSDGTKLMIDNGWMEAPPMAVDREKLTDG